MSEAESIVAAALDRLEERIDAILERTPAKAEAARREVEILRQRLFRIVRDADA